MCILAREFWASRLAVLESAPRMECFNEERKRYLDNDDDDVRVERDHSLVIRKGTGQPLDIENGFFAISRERRIATGIIGFFFSSGFLSQRKRTAIKKKKEKRATNINTSAGKSIPYAAPHGMYI